jgi:MYXO-CTERM domain-containing protein
MSFSGLSWGDRWSRRAGVGFVSAVLATFASVSPAHAVVTEPNGLSVPQPVSTAETNIATSRGFTAPALTLQGLFATQCFNDPIDPVADADTQPAAFSPLCGFTGTLVMRGGGCRLELGWYNATASGQTPTDAEIYTLVPADTVGRDFCPLAAVHTNDPNRADTAEITAECNSCPLGRGTGVTTFTATSIRDDMRYKAPPNGTGLIGFALRGSTATQCPQTHFSQNDLNPDCTTGCTTPGPWIMTLVYTSKVMADSFYIAFEDLPATNFGPNQGQNDGDFNDFVYLISGLTCEGGGQPCAVPDVVGACAAGVTACGPGGVITCSKRIEPTTEVCDNIDNDCNGAVDDNPALCTADNKVCYQGKCVPRCNTGEFQCLPGEMCNPEGLCIDAACNGITCAEGEICRGGDCVGACDGVMCPFTANGQQECQLGRCVDLCAVSTCPDGTVCERGSCVRHCECRDCPNNTLCNRDEASAAFGQCVDTACATKQCAAGQICFLGECRDPCAGAVCPGGAACENGACGPPGTAGSGGTGGSSNGGSAGSIIAGTTNGGTIGFGGTSAASGGGGGDQGLGSTPTGDPGCACRTTGSRGASWLVTLLVAAVAGAFGVRRRQRA